jgi:lysyl-tRNA synthetase class 2
MNDKWKSQCSLETLKQRAFLLAKIREYFAKNDVLEVETPILSSAGNTDINIESFTSEGLNPDHSQSYLRTSPEFALKRLLCSGMGDVFEIAKVFRKSEISRTHNIEFTMLEWYRLNFDYLDLIEDVTSLFKIIFSCFKLPDVRVDIIDFYQCFEHFLKINIKTVTLENLNNTCHTYGYSGSQLTHDQALDFLFATQIQPQFDTDVLTFITHYPATQAALAEINPDDTSVCLRFEVFYQGHELGNGYQELTDANELLQRFKHDNLTRIQNQQKTIKIDDNLLKAMQNGMPNCSGIAIGIDRLLLVLLGCSSINQVLTFNAFNS